MLLAVPGLGYTIGLGLATARNCPLQGHPQGPRLPRNTLGGNRVSDQAEKVVSISASAPSIISGCQFLFAFLNHLAFLIQIDRSSK